ncbi:serine/threonine-protein kinase [Labedaea rhizosphaerae]|uniref:non-specific serine/threonine protein kinase n=1 Tax=Labedaea rhizosphaerae TaxID=598644 RepID=A0A4R6SGZ6_LABRH|nr:serine/threonine-protein kinase [Labedaea rhizosphaerae]TDQ00198.1 serine/threonine protein kinase [Labedaea rhizosphaerae]
MTDGSRLIAQRYRLDAPVGVGGMGEVYRATDLELRRTVALKRSQAGDSAQIRREARIGAGLHHPHVVTVFDAVTDGADRWLVMEYLPSRNLNEILRSDGPLPAVTAARVIGQIADAVAAMHAKGMVHRDIKPGNVLVADDGTAKLTDLGIARWAEVTHTSDTEAGGTPGYLAPEVADGGDADARADVFALGATLFAATTGRSPWGGAEQGPYVQVHRARNYQLEPLPDNELNRPLRALLARDPADRPTAAHTHLGLATMADGAAPPVVPLGSGPATATSSRKPNTTRRTQFAAAAAVVLLLVVAGVVFLRPSDAVTGKPSAASLPPQPGAILDPHTMDPCAVLNRDSLSGYGSVALNRDYYNFDKCGLQVDVRGGGIVAATAEFLPWDDSYAAPKPGQVVGPDHPDTQNGHCRRTFTLPAPNVVVLDLSEPGKDSSSLPLCAMADRLATPAVAVLSRGPLPRLTEPYPPQSLAWVRACSLTSAQELTTVIGSAPPGQPGLGDWTCEWGEDGAKQVYLEFNRDWPLDDPDEGIGADGDPIALSDRPGWTDVDHDDNGCEVEFSHREFATGDRVPGAPTQREDTIKITLYDPDAADPATLCAGATSLANVAIGKLPR